MNRHVREPPPTLRHDTLPPWPSLKVCQVAVSFTLFPKPLSVKYVLGGVLVVLALAWLQRSGKRAVGAPPDAIDGAVPADGPPSVSADMTPGSNAGAGKGSQGSREDERP